MQRINAVRFTEFRSTVQSTIVAYRAIIVSGLALTLALSASLFNKLDAQTKNPRPLARGVLKTIPEDLNPRDMFSLPKPLLDLKATKYQTSTVPYRKTLHGQSDRVVMFRDNVWQLEFSFIGLRQANLQIPDANGDIENRNVWYLIYRIRDTGKTMTFDQVKQHPEFDHIKFELKRGEAVPKAKRKFLPRFTLEGWVAQKDDYKKVEYRDEINPIIVEQIRRREDKNMRLLDTHQMSQANIPVAKNSADPGAWGVAVWEDVDPRLDYVSIYIKGLTNAFRLSDNMKDPSKLKTLQLNFWRPGDTFAEERDFVQYGIPLVDDPKKQALICERYNLPGPIIRGYHVNQQAKREVLVVEADAQVDLKNFESALAPTLDKGKLPPEIAKAFSDAGIAIDNGAAVTTTIPGNKWSMNQNGQEYILNLEPQFWEPDFGKIRFIKSLDYIWIYR